jgi:hypothetical protein
MTSKDRSLIVSAWNKVAGNYTACDVFKRPRIGCHIGYKVV